MRFDALGEDWVVDSHAEFDVVLFGAFGEVGAGYQQVLVVDGDELGVVAWPVAGLVGSSAQDDGSSEFGGNLLGGGLPRLGLRVGDVGVDVHPHSQLRARSCLAQCFPQHRGALEVVGGAHDGLPGGGDEMVDGRGQLAFFGEVAWRRPHGHDRTGVGVSTLDGAQDSGRQLPGLRAEPGLLK